MREPNWYQGGPTVPAAEGEDDWHGTSQLGRVDLDANNDLSGGTETHGDDAEVE